jgi:hypothetical protein
VKKKILPKVEKEDLRKKTTPKLKRRKSLKLLRSKRKLR